MARVIYNTASTLNGFIADDNNSLDWLFEVESPDGGELESFLQGIGVFVEGSTTYEWVLRQERLLEEPHRWAGFYGDRPTYVFTSRDLPVPEGADVRFVAGPVQDALPAIIDAAGERDVWVVGGGDLAGQFLDAGALDEIQVSIAPAAVTGGAPLLPRVVGARTLSLRSVEQRGQFAHLSYDVHRG
ncbi:dihydrofolate reductase family protein [Lacisediminihabitans profunda]|uniref:Dihydrofolate reductase n=1 Tax=Lacisediminihabitans profunda TaxID=2594790 RepID=A0A5C8UUR6_9MICO|nr:dihydrofolate reductase family protein [Lacisediminihabitans profunda]TXN31386.1 dihydrofolate reductase [Lacisediminihabitans profunda]